MIAYGFHLARASFGKLSCSTKAKAIAQNILERYKCSSNAGRILVPEVSQPAVVAISGVASGGTGSKCSTIIWSGRKPIDS